MIVDTRRKQASVLKTHIVQRSLVYNASLGQSMPFLCCSLARVPVSKDRQGQVSVCLEFREWRSTYATFIGLFLCTSLAWGTVYMCEGQHTRALLLLWWSEIFGVAWCGPTGAAARSRLGVLGFHFGLKLLSHMTPRSHSNVAQRYIIACWHFSLSTPHQSCWNCVDWMMARLHRAGNNRNNNACQTLEHSVTSYWISLEYVFRV